MEAVKKVLITGASGHLGSELVITLSKDFEVIGVTRKRHIAIESVKVKEAQFDLSKESAIEKLIALKPEIIIHTAALSNVDYCQLNPQEAQLHNVIATANVVAAARALGSSLLFISTDHVFDGRKPTAYTEEDRPNPVNIYGATKLGAEDIIKNRLKNFIILRVSWLFGNPKLGFLNYVLISAKGQKSIPIVSDKRSSPTYNFDISLAIEFLIGNVSFSGETLHFTNSGSGCSWFEYAKEILSFSRMDDIEIRPISFKELNLPALRPMNSVLDNRKFGQIYGRPVRSWQEALKECIQERYLKGG